MMQQLNTIKNDKDKKRKLKDTERRLENAKKIAKLEATKADKEKERRKDYFRKEQRNKSKSSSK